MSNPLASLFNRPQQPAAQNNFGDLLARFQQFRNTFKGDPRQMVEDLRRSGRMSEEQFKQLSEMATRIQNSMR